MIRPQNRAELEDYVLQLLKSSLQGTTKFVAIPDEIVHDALASEKPSTLSEDANAGLWQNDFCAREATLDCVEDDGKFKFRWCTLLS